MKGLFSGVELDARGPVKEEKLAKTPPKIATCSLRSASLRRDNYAETETQAVNSSAYRDWQRTKPG